MKCYLCPNELCESTNAEHIIHNFLGGRLKSKEIICSDCGQKTSLTIDADLSHQITLGNLIEIKRDRKSDCKIAATSVDGVKYLIEKGGQIGEQRPLEPRKVIDKNGELTFEIKGTKNIEEFIKAYKKKHPTISDLDLESKIRIITQPKPVEVYPVGDTFQPLNGPSPYRAIAKIAANFYKYNTQDDESIKAIAKFIVTDEFTKEHVAPYYKFSREELLIESDETSHILILIGDHVNKLLYCYMELFNVYNNVVLLNLQYNGPSYKFFHRLYCKSGTYNSNQIDLSFDPKEIRNLEFPGKNSEAGFGTRMREFAKANQIKLAVRPNINFDSTDLF